MWWFDTNSLEHWKHLLDDLEGNVDEELWIKQIPTLKKDVRIKIKEVLDLTKITFEIDEKNKKIKLFNEKQEFIWEMYEWIYWILEESFPHNWIEINKKFRWKWYWKILFEKFKDIFWVNDIEYTRKKDSLQFLINMGYRAVSIIDESDWNEEDIAHLEEEKVLKSLKKWYTIKLVF